MRFEITRRKRRVAICIVAVLLVGVALSWTYAEYQAHRAKQLLAAAARIRIGDSEASIQPLLRRFGGGECVPSETPEEYLKENQELRENLVAGGVVPFDQAGYEYWLRTRPDCTYFFDVDPWLSPLASKSRRLFGSRVYTYAKLAMWAIPGRVRSLVGMREWNAATSISIRRGRVNAVHAGVYVESRDHWLGHHWKLMEELPPDPYRRPSVEYEVDGELLTFGFGSDSGPGEAAIISRLTNGADKEQVQAAQGLNMRCLTRAFACKAVCDLSRPAIEYLKHHPGSDRGYSVPECR